MPAKEQKRLGLIRVSEKYLLAGLLLDGGVIHRAWMSNENVLEIIVEHPDFEEIAEGIIIPAVQITEEVRYSQGRRVAIRRTSPPHRDGQKHWQRFSPPLIHATRGEMARDPDAS